MRRGQKSSRIFVLILALLLVIPNFVFAMGNTVSLVSVSVNSGTYTLTDNSITIAKKFQPNTPLDFDLLFSHNVTIDTYQGENLRKLSIVNDDTNTEQTYTYYASDAETTILTISAYSGLAEGNYKIVVDSGVASNAGATDQEYNIYFTVGSTGTNPGGSHTYENNKVEFNVSGVTDTDYFVQVKKDGEIFDAVEDNNKFDLANGTYAYVVSASGYLTQQGTFTVNGADQTINITMSNKIVVTFATVPDEATVRVKSGQDNYIEPDAGTDKTFTLTPGMEYTYVAELSGYTTNSSRFTPITDQTITLGLNQSSNTGDGYCEQGNGGNTLTMLIPGAEDITVVQETTDHYYNTIDTSFDASGDITFGFTMSAGINAIGDGSSFKKNNMPLINIYKSDGAGGATGSAVATYSEGSGLLKYIGYNENDSVGRVIRVGVDAGVLSEGTYVLVFGKNICGNNINKTIGKDIIFEFTVTNTAPTPEPTPEPIDVYAKFTDLVKDAWYADAVSFVVNRGLFNGTSETTFSPDVSMNRAMSVTVLGRLAGVDGAQTVGSTFYDVENGGYYAPYVSWGAKNGIIFGYEDGSFRPDKSISREEMVVIMYRYAKVMGYDVSNTDSTKLNTFSDASKTASWARDAVSWAVNSGIINGKGNGIIDPTGYTTRAEEAQILMNYVKVLESM